MRRSARAGLSSGSGSRGPRWFGSWASKHAFACVAHPFAVPAGSALSFNAPGLLHAGDGSGTTGGGVPAFTTPLKNFVLLAATVTSIRWHWVPSWLALVPEMCVSAMAVSVTGYWILIA